MMNKDKFFKKTKNLSVIKSKTGKATYSNFSLAGNILSFSRVEKDTVWKLDLLELFEFYKKESFFNTSIIKANLKHRTNSPALAILMAIGACDKAGFKK